MADDDYKYGSMDIRAQEQTFAGFVTFVMRATVVILAIFVLLALFAS